jgi:hypothetical protein
MKKFMFLYNGPATPMEQMSVEQSEKNMKAYTQWASDAGGAIVEMGTPLVAASSIKDDGSAATTPQVVGYSIVQADSKEEAAKLADGHPFLADKSGKFQIDIFEMVPIEM